MANKRSTIGAIIKLDGESSFRNSISNCKNAVSAMKSELSNIIKSYDGSANSLQALTEVQAKYSDIQQRAHEQAEKMATAYEKSSKKQDEVKESMEQMKTAYAEAQKTLDRMQTSGTETAEAIEEQEKATDAAYKAYLQYESAVEKAESRTGYFQKALADAKGEEIAAGEAIKKYASYIEEAKNSTDGVASSIDGYGNEIKKAGESAREGGAGVAVFTGALSANVVTAGLEKAIDVLKEGVEYAVQVGSEFEASQSKVKAISGATADEMSQIEEMSKKLGRTTKFSASEISEGFSFMALAGYTATQQLSAMPGVVNLAIAAETNLGEASDMVTDYLSAFGLGAEYAGEMADMLAYAMSHSNANVEQFGEAWKNSAANMNAAGQSMQTTTAILEALANQGRKGSEAGTTLKAIMRDITSKMQDGAIAIGDTTVQVQDANGNFRDLIDILADVETATDGMGTAARAAALSAVFTDDSITGVNMALQEGVGNIRGYKDELEDCDGASERMSKTINDNLSGSMKNLSSAAEGLGNAVYSYIGGPLTGVVDGVTDAINDITDAIEPQVTEVTRFVDLVVEAKNKINDAVSTADTNYTTGMANASEMQEYLTILEGARNKENLTEFQTYQLNNAIKSLAGNVPELNDYIDDTGKLLGLSSTEFNNLKNIITKDYKNLIAQVIIEKRNAYAQIMADSEIANEQAKSAAKNAEQEMNENLDENFTALDKIKLTLNSITSMGGTGGKLEALWQFKELYDAVKPAQDAADAVKDTGEAFEDAKKQYDEFSDMFPELSKEYGIIQDENGNWTLSLEDSTEATKKAADATADAADSISDSSEQIGDSAEEVTDTVRNAVATYTTKMQELKNADPSDIIRDQLAAAAAQVQEFQNTMQSNLSSFSLFGDRSSLIDAYTNTNRDEMKLNMSWALSSMKNYTQELDELQKRGVSSDFIDYLTSQGQAGLNYVHSLALASDEELKQFQQAFKEYESYTTGVNDNVKNLLTDYAAGISAGIADGYNSWYEFGIETTAGLFDAINEAMEAIKNGTISGDITDALQVVLQNKADQIEAQKTARKAAAAAQLDSARQTTGHTGNKTKMTSNNDDLRITDRRNVVVNVTSPVYLDSKKISESNKKNAKARSKITGRSESY